MFREVPGVAADREGAVADSSRAVRSSRARPGAGSTFISSGQLGVAISPGEADRVRLPLALQLLL